MAWNTDQLVGKGIGRDTAKEILKNYNITVAELPSAALYPYRRGIIITDASATTYNATIGVSGKTVSGGGSNVVPVFSDGSNWRIG